MELEDDAGADNVEDDTWEKMKKWRLTLVGLVKKVQKKLKVILVTMNLPKRKKNKFRKYTVW